MLDKLDKVNEEMAKKDEENKMMAKEMEEMKKNMQKTQDLFLDQNKEITDKLDILIKAFPKSAVTKKPLLKD